MDAQLDRDASRILQRQLEAMGLQVLTNRTTTAAPRRRTGDAACASRTARRSPATWSSSRPASGPTSSSRRRPGSRSSAASWSATTSPASDTDGVYAIGECAEHRGQLYGLVAPLWEQAQVLADRLTRPTSRRRLHRLASHDEAEGRRARRRRHGPEGRRSTKTTRSSATPSRRAASTRSSIVRDNRLAGAILIGDGPVVPGADAGLCRRAARSAERRSELLFPPPMRRAVPRAGAAARRRADLRLQRRVEGADRGRGAAGREQPPGGLRRHARRHGMRLVPARGPADRRARLPRASRRRNCCVAPSASAVAAGRPRKTRTSSSR